MRKLILFLLSFYVLSLSNFTNKDSLAAIPPPPPPGYATCKLEILGDSINLGTINKQGCLKLCESSQSKGKLRCEFLNFNLANSSPTILKTYPGNSPQLGSCALEGTYGKSNVTSDQCIAWCKDIYAREGATGPLRYLDSVKCRFNNAKVLITLSKPSSNQSSCTGPKPCCMSDCPNGMCTQVCGESKCVNGNWVCKNSNNSGNGDKCSVSCPDGTSEAGIIRNGSCEGLRGRSTCFNSNQSSCTGSKPCCSSNCNEFSCTPDCGGSSKCVNGNWVCTKQIGANNNTVNCPCPEPTCGSNDLFLNMKNNQIMKTRKDNKCTNPCPVASCSPKFLPTTGIPGNPMNTR